MKQENSFISQEQYQLIAETEAKFILEHAEKQIKDILETSSQIVSRSTTLLTLIVGLMIALLSYCFKTFETNNHIWTNKLFIASWLAVYLGIVVINLLLNFVPKTYFIAGAEPADFFKSDEVFIKSNSDYRMVAIYVNEITQAQIKIIQNKSANEKKWKNFNRAIYLIAGIPVAIVLLYWISTFQCLNLA